VPGRERDRARQLQADDILTLHSKKTVEINNTDAEGRLLLADGTSYAARELGADVVLDAATLTGAQLIATGDLHGAVVSNDEELERILVEAGRTTGDLTHPLPFAPELYKPEFKTPYADMRNSVKNRNNAQSSCAAQFVYWHIEDLDVRWGHSTWPARPTGAIEAPAMAWRCSRRSCAGSRKQSDHQRDTEPSGGRE
jgi:leucyl aminopeptidase